MLHRDRLEEGIGYLRDMKNSLSCFKGQTKSQFDYLGSKYHIISFSLAAGFFFLSFLLFMIYLKL